MDGADSSSRADPNVIDSDDDKTASVPIAIIGMSCKFPGGATSPGKLWRMCVEGRSGWSEIPKSRFNAAAFFDED
jgi:acyl transferase domain-containing protein